MGIGSSKPPVGDTTQVSAEEVAQAPIQAATVTRIGAPTMQATVRGIPQLEAQITRVHEVGPYGVFTGYRDTWAHLDLDTKKLSKREKALWGETEKKLDTAWNLAKGLIPEGAFGLKINYTQCYVSYKTADASGAETVHYLRENQLEPRMYELMKEIRGAAKQLWKRVNMNAEYGDGGNRPITPDRPFEIVSQKWENARPSTLDQYMKPPFFGKLAQVVAAQSTDKKQERVDDAFDRTVATEAFLQSLHREIATLRHQQEMLISDQAFSARPPADQKKIRKAHTDLSVLEQLASPAQFKRDAVMAAVALWGKTDPKKADKRTRFAIADQIQQMIRYSLAGELRPGVDERGWVKRSLGWGDDEAIHLQGLGPFIQSYAADAGALVLDDKFEYIEKTERSGEAYKGVSMEQLVTETMKHFGDAGLQASFDANQALGVFGIAFDPETRGQLVQALNRSGTEAQNVYTAAQGTRGQSWENRWEAIQKDPRLAAPSR